MEIKNFQYNDNLQSPRLTTRFFTQDDVPLWTPFFEDVECTEFHPNENNLTPEQRSREWINVTIARYRDNRLGMQALFDKQTGEFIGQCGLIVQDPNGKQEIEIGYHLLRRHWGKGYAIEAAQMFRDYGFEHDFADSLVSIIHPLNVNSKKVAERNGMHLSETSVFFKGKHYDLFRITRKEWEQLKNKQA